MKLAIASGKGGTGKTTVATNLAWLAAAGGRRVAYLDCDVEAPNGAIFLGEPDTGAMPVEVLVPDVDADRCIGCGRCGEICQFSAIVAMGAHVLTFPELCHSCGGCRLVCPTGAVREVPRRIGEVRTGVSKSVAMASGMLDIGQAMSPPLIRAVKAAAPPADLVIVDCPPGTSCPAMEALPGSDYALLVTEPTPFGLNDLKLAVETCRALRIPFGVVINRAGSGDDKTYRYCATEGIAIVGSIADAQSFAEAYSRGELLAEVSLAGRQCFETLLGAIDARSDRKEKA